MRVLLFAIILLYGLAVSCKEKKAIKKQLTVIRTDSDVTCACGMAPPPPAPPPTSDYYDEQYVTIKKPTNYKLKAALSFQWDLIWGESVMWMYKLKVYSPYDTAYDSFVVAAHKFWGEDLRIENNDAEQSMKMVQVIKWDIASDSLFRTLFTMSADTLGQITISRNETPFVRNRY